MILPIYIEQLGIEITRKCNLSCPHCMRGEPQDINISYKSLKKIGNQVKQIGEVVISGGEPSLNIKGINLLLSIFKEKQIKIHRAFIKTNAIITDQLFINTMLLFDSFCSDGLELWISNTIWHKNKRDVHKTQQFIKQLDFAKIEEVSTIDNERFYAQGSALYYPSNLIHFKPVKDHKKLFYINCNGEVLKCGELSYKEQKRRKIGCL